MPRTRKVDTELCAIMLRKLHKEGPLTRTELLKCALKYGNYATEGRFRGAIRQLIAKGWIEKTGQPKTHTPYKITEKGLRFLEAV